jgi:hypothetical protein
MTEAVLNLGTDANVEKAFVSRAADPVVSNVGTPIDFAAQYPQPLNTEELVAMCEELGAWKAIPELRTSLQSETWRELNELAFTSGSAYIAFPDGECPTEYYHDGDNKTVTTKWIGAKKSLTISDIMHSAAVAAAGWNGINQLVGGFAAFQGLPGTDGGNTFTNQMVGNLKAKEMTLASTLVMNGWDKLLVTGDVDGNALEFDGIQNYVTAGNGARANTGSISGAFTVADFDRFLSEGCATPTDIFGHPQAIQEVMSAYFALGGVAVQNIGFGSGARITPGFNFGSEINTGAGTMRVHADRHFTKTAFGTTQFQSKLFALRMNHNGMPLVYKLSQIPLSFKDLTPGCTAISFTIQARTALVIKALCAQASYIALYTGKAVASCPII